VPGGCGSHSRLSPLREGSLSLSGVRSCLHDEVELRGSRGGVRHAQRRRGRCGRVGSNSTGCSRCQVCKHVQIFVKARVYLGGERVTCTKGAESQDRVKAGGWSLAGRVHSLCGPIFSMFQIPEEAFTVSDERETALAFGRVFGGKSGALDDQPPAHERLHKE